MNRLPHQAQAHLRAFTLIELLVVIATIAIIAALLLPTLGRSMERVRGAQCRSNLRQWSIAFISYSDDHEFIPRECSPTNGRVRIENWANVSSSDARDVWYNALPDYLSEAPAKVYASALTGARGRFYESRIFHCPSAEFPAAAATDGNAIFSLAMNAKLIQPPIRHPNASIPLGLIERPAHTVIFQDSRITPAEGKIDPLQTDWDLGQPSASASRFSKRHHAGSNLAFADGRVSWFLGTAVVETRQGRPRGVARYPDAEIIWTPDPLMEPFGVE